MKLDLPIKEVGFPPDWFPMCRKCGEPVERIDVIDRPDLAIKKLRIHCHGETEETIIGIWAAFEIYQSGGRMPDAFTK